MFNFRMPNVNIGRALGQVNPMKMMGSPMHTIQDAFGQARNISPMTQAMGMMQRHPQDPFNGNHDLRQILGQHMQSQPHEMPDPMHPNPMANMAGMNLSQMQGMQPQGQPMQSPMMNPNMGTKSGMAPMGTPIGRGGLPTTAAGGHGMQSAMDALNAQRPVNPYTNPNQSKIQQMQNMAQMIGRNR